MMMHGLTNVKQIKQINLQECLLTLLSMNITDYNLHHSNFACCFIYKYRSKTLSLTLRGDPRLKVIQKRVLRKIFG